MTPPARAAPPERVRIEGFAVSPTTAEVGQVITFSFVIRNIGAGSLFPGSPPPGTLYTQGESYRNKGRSGAPGAYRVAVGWRGDGERYPFRWGLGESIYSGQVGTVHGRVRMRRPGTYSFTAQMERVGAGRVGAARALRLEVRPARRWPLVLVNGDELAIRRARPQRVSGVLLVPLRPLADAIGAGVEWDARQRQATLRRAGRVVVLRAGRREYTVDGERRVAPVSPRLSHGEVMVPLRATAEALLARVGWDPASRAATVTTQSRPAAVLE